MANTVLKIDLEKRVKNFKKTAKKVNKQVIANSEELVDGTLEAGAKWQDVFAKAMKAGTVLFGKQQDLTLKTLEGVKGQVVTGSKRMRDLLEVDYIANKVMATVRNTTNVVEKKAKATFEDVKETLEDTLEDVKETATKANIKAKQTIDEVLDSAVKVNGKAKKSITQVTAQVEAATFGKDNLKKIDGVGPKLETILNEAGILTYDDLAAAKINDLKNILAEAGPRYQMHNPATWSKQAKMAAAGKWEALKKFQDDLKSSN